LEVIGLRRHKKTRRRQGRAIHEKVLAHENLEGGKRKNGAMTCRYLRPKNRQKRGRKGGEDMAFQHISVSRSNKAEGEPGGGVSAWAMNSYTWRCGWGEKPGRRMRREDCRSRIMHRTERKRRTSGGKEKGPRLNRPAIEVQQIRGYHASGSDSLGKGEKEEKREDIDEKER